jgi:hypothetical protein
MKTLANLASALVLAGAAMTVPLSAMAGETSATEAAHHHPLHVGFPLKADVFRKMVDKRVAGFRVVVEKEMGRANLPAEKRVEVRKGIDVAALEIKKEVDKVAADGLVTKEEAKELKEMAGKLRQKIEKEIPRDKHARRVKHPKHNRAKGT